MTQQYTPAADRYEKMCYERCGNSGVALPRISLGLWHNFGSESNFEVAKEMIHFAFDQGVTHFDLANNYGPIPGSAETNFGHILRDGMLPYRDEMIISSKAGHEMWAGPYGGNSSRKNIIASANQSLKRTGLEYFDIFYTHRYDGSTPIEETAQALIDLVRSGKALYAGISKYPPKLAIEMYDLLEEANVPCLISQYKYSMFERTIEARTIPLAADRGSGVIAFSPLAQGLLAGRYLDGIPEGSRAASSSIFLTPDSITPEKIKASQQLNELAIQRGQTLAQMALAWTLRDTRVTSVIIGASSVGQIRENLGALDNLGFTSEELKTIDKILNDK
ncbi:MAG: aldo/keto reductase [Rikenellaceae bacterium]